MSNSRAAIRYAKAIIERANLKGVTQEINNDMKLIASVIKSNKDLNDFIHNPTIKVELKANALAEVFSGINSETKELFRLLTSNKRFEILEQIAQQYSFLFNQENNVEIVKVTTAVPITPGSDIEAKVLAKIKEFSNKSIVIQNIIDPAIIGGFILRIDDKQYNTSIANKLQVLKREFRN